MLPFLKHIAFLEFCTKTECSLFAATPRPQTPQNPCYPGKCGTNAQCRVHNDIGVCSCLPEHFGNPYDACKPECVVSTDCVKSKGCERNKCVDPCPGVCGFRAECRVHDHVAMCYCPEGYKGDPFRACTPVPVTEPPREPVKTDPCYPSPCGPNTECVAKGDDDDGQAVAICKCLPGYPKGDPVTGCRPECTKNADCPHTQACGSQQKCVDPCPGLCGTNALCTVVNHNPMCTCKQGYQGNAYDYCSPIPGE